MPAPEQLQPFPLDIDDLRNTTNEVLSILNLAFTKWRVVWEDDQYVARVREGEGRAAMGHPSMTGMAPWIAKQVAEWSLRVLATENGTQYETRKEALVQAARLAAATDSLPIQLLGVEEKGISSKTIIAWMVALYRAQMTTQMHMEELLSRPDVLNAEHWSSTREEREEMRNLEEEDSIDLDAWSAKVLETGRKSSNKPAGPKPFKRG